MRTAICWSGQPREVGETLESFLACLYRRLPDPDVFIYTSQSFPEKVISTLRPKVYLVEPQQVFEGPEKVLERVGFFLERPHPHFNDFLQMIYGYKRVGELKRQYEASHKVSYDLVIRCRPDLLYMRPFSAEWFDPKALNIFREVKDFAMDFVGGSGPHMDQFMAFFDWLGGPGQEFLQRDRRRATMPGQTYAGDKIAQAYLFDFLGLECRPLVATSTAESDHYRIMRLHKKGLYPPFKP